VGGYAASEHLLGYDPILKCPSHRGNPTDSQPYARANAIAHTQPNAVTNTKSHDTVALGADTK